jgi:hypothetical protein
MTDKVKSRDSSVISKKKKETILKNKVDDEKIMVLFEKAFVGIWLHLCALCNDLSLAVLPTSETL